MGRTVAALGGLAILEVGQTKVSRSRSLASNGETSVHAPSRSNRRAVGKPFRVGLAPTTGRTDLPKWDAGLVQGCPTCTRRWVRALGSCRHSRGHTVPKSLIWFLGLLLVVGGVAGGAWWWWRGRDVRSEIEAALSDALGREVHVVDYEVDPRGHVTLTGVDIGNPTGWDGAALMRAAKIDLDVAMGDLLDREIAGVLSAEGVELRIVREGGVTNLHGLLRPSTGGGGGGQKIDLHLDVAITGARVTIEDHDRDNSFVLEDVDVRALVANREDATGASATVRIARIDLRGIPVTDVRMVVQKSGSDVAIDDLKATVGSKGTLTGSAKLLLAEDRDWSVQVELVDVDLDADVRRIVAAVYPPLVSTVEQTAATGSMGATLALTGTGVHWSQVKPTLAGTGTLRVHDVVLPKGSLLLNLAGLIGRDPSEPWALGASTIEFAVGQGWVTLAKVTAEGVATSLPITGRVSLDGELDLKADLMPLVPLFGGGAYASVATSLPVGITGTVEAPKLAPPSVSDVGKSLLGGVIRRSLGTAPK